MPTVLCTEEGIQNVCDGGDTCCSKDDCGKASTRSSKDAGNFEENVIARSSNSESVRLTLPSKSSVGAVHMAGKGNEGALLLKDEFSGEDEDSNRPVKEDLREDSNSELIEGKGPNVGWNARSGIKISKESFEGWWMEALDNKQSNILDSLETPRESQADC